MSNILVSLNISEAGDGVSLLVGRFQVLESLMKKRQVSWMLALPPRLCLISSSVTVKEKHILSHKSSAESQKGVNDDQQCSVENQKGAIAM